MERVAMSEDQPTESQSGEEGPQADRVASAAGDQVHTASGQSDSGQPMPSPLARIAELEARVAELEREVAAEREAATDYMQRWQRAQADFSNLKRRVQQDQGQLQRLAGARALAGILPAVDSFERAFATLPPSLRGLSWIDGVGLVHLQLHGALQAAGIRGFAPERGSAFDPRTQQAIGDVETRDVEPGTVAVVVQQGFALGDLVLRPALVQLARAPQESKLEASQAASQEAKPEAASRQSQA